MRAVLTAAQTLTALSMVLLSHATQPRVVAQSIDRATNVVHRMRNVSQQSGFYFTRAVLTAVRRPVVPSAQLSRRPKGKRARRHCAGTEIRCCENHPNLRALQQLHRWCYTMFRRYFI